MEGLKSVSRKKAKFFTTRASCAKRLVVAHVALLASLAPRISLPAVSSAVTVEYDRVAYPPLALERGYVANWSEQDAGADMAFGWDIGSNAPQSWANAPGKDRGIMISLLLAKAPNPAMVQVRLADG